MVRNRTASDAVSGLSLDRSHFPGYSDEDIHGHWQTFHMYDLDSTGFISPENLLDVLKAMEVAGATIQMVNSIIEEVAVLSGHDNDGKLSFRDYMRCITYDHDAAVHNLALDAEAELGISVREEEEESARQSSREEEAPGAPAVDPLANAVDVSETAADPPAAPAESPNAKPKGRMRQSSMGALSQVAASRIRAFQQVADDVVAKQNKIDAFKHKPAALSGPIVNSDDLAKETLRNKVKAFETAAKFKGKVELKKTWRQVGGAGNYSAGTKIVAEDGSTKPPPKKKLTDLP